MKKSKRKKLQEVEDKLDGLKQYICELSATTSKVISARSKQEAEQLARKPYRGIVWDVGKVEEYDENYYRVDWETLNGN